MATRLDAKHMIQAINYYVGLVEFEPREYEEMDREILREDYMPDCSRDEA
jgi:hypothetical protein